MSDLQITFCPAGEGSVDLITGSRHVNKLTALQSGGAFIAFEFEVPPDTGPPMHFHDHDAEWMYVMSGSVTFMHEGGSVVANAGDSIFLPAGVAHAFRNEGKVPARGIAVSTPGTALQAFFHESDQQLKGRVDGPVLVDIAAKHGITFGVPKAAAAA